MARFRRKDLKRPDQFISATRRALIWADANRRQVSIGAGVFVAIIVAIAAIGAVRSTRSYQANVDLAQGLAQMHGEHFVEAATQLKDTAARWQGTATGSIAELFEAQANLLANNHDAAAAALSKLVEQGGQPAYLGQEAVTLVASVTEDKGDFGKAAELYAKARTISGPYTAVALLGEARSRDKLGEHDRAVALYQSFVDEYPQSKDEAFVSARLAALKTS